MSGSSRSPWLSGRRLRQSVRCQSAPWTTYPTFPLLTSRSGFSLNDLGRITRTAIRLTSKRNHLHEPSRIPPGFVGRRAWLSRSAENMPPALSSREAKRGRADRLRLVRQGRPAPLDPGRTRRGRLALRRRQENAGRGSRNRRPAAKPPRKPRAPTPTIAKCSRRKISTSS